MKTKTENSVGIYGTYKKVPAASAAEEINVRKRGETTYIHAAAVRAVCYAAFSVALAGAYVAVGLVTHIWHPTWVLLLGSACASAVGTARELCRIR